MAGASTFDPAPGTRTTTMKDDATGATIGTWTNQTASSYVASTLAFAITYGGTTDTLSIDTVVGAPWNGPQMVVISHADLLQGAIHVTASFAGAARLAPSSSAAVPL